MENVAIVLLNWNGYELTKACLASLSQTDYLHINIYLVDNASADGSGPVLKKEFGDKVHFIQNKDNLGFAGGNNVAVNQALQDGNEFIMLLNNDTEVDPGFVLPLVNSLKSDATLGAVQPLILDLNHKELVWNAGGRTNRFLGVSKTKFEGDALANVSSKIVKETDWITGCCIMLRASVIKKVGLLDEKFFAYHEDVDWSIRIRKAGFQLALVKESIVYHMSMASLKSSDKGKEGYLSPFMHYLNVRNHLYLLRKHSDFFNPIGPWLNQFFKFIGYMGYFLIRRRFTKLKAVLRGFRDGLTQ